MYIKEHMKNGIRIVAEEINYVNSVSIGIWVKSGPRYENIKNNGVSHFVEHMLFKGTGKRTAKEIASSIDKIGGQLNAFTSKESTCFYVKVLDSHFDIALDVLSDMIINSSFIEAEIEKEKKVVLEEINMYEDSPEDLVHDIYTQTVLSNHSLGMPILGTKDSLNSFTRNKIIEYIDTRFTPENIVISLVGNFNKEDAFKKIKDAFGSISTSNKTSTEELRPSFIPDVLHREKNTEQAHLCLGFKGFELDSDYVYPMLVLNNIFGGSMSSRLFQKIREDNGLAYSVFSYPSSYTDCGLFTIYAGMQPKQLQIVLDLINHEIKYLKENGISEEELYDSKEQLKGNYTLGLESTSGRMISIGKSELLLNKIRAPKEVLGLIDSVEMNDIDFVIDYIFNEENKGIAIIGPEEKYNL